MKRELERARIDERYPELTALHQEFMRALTADPKPLFKSAFFN